MPRLSRFFIRSSFLCLAVGMTIGGLMLSVKGGVGDPLWWRWLPVHILLLMNGWLLQLSMGVAYWIFPRIIGHERGRRRWAWTAFVLYQVGLGMILLVLLEIWWQPARLFIIPAILLQLLAIALYAYHLYPRVRPAIVRATNMRIR